VAHYNLATALLRLRRSDEALPGLLTAARLLPESPLVHRNLGIALLTLGKPAEARRAFERVIELAPDRPLPYCQLGTLKRYEGRLDEALRCFDRALAIEPNFAEAIYGRGLTCLAAGQFAEGWTGFERRIDSLNRPDTLPLAEPAWDGSFLDGRTLLVHAEQGLGDTLQFIRFAPLAAKQAGRAVLAVQRSLIPLLADSGFGPLVARDGPLPAFDLQVPLMSLPFVLGTTLDTLPRDVPYLRASPARVGRWRTRLAGLQGLKVGIAWQGSRSYELDRLRSIPLACFAPLAAVAGVSLVSLQKPEAGAQGAQANALFPLTTFDDLDAGEGAFGDTAAVIANLDLVVTSDSAMAHLAGALGAPVWLALSALPDWRWMFERPDSPWYPTMRLFRQPSLGDWSAVFSSMAAELFIRRAARA
jgi:tetratricopeptide (TPR) repeat protein